MDKLVFTDILESGLSRKEKVKQVAERIRAAGNYSWVGIYDVKEREISIIACSGRPEPAFTSFPKDKGLNGKAVTQQKTVIVNDARSDDDYLLTFTNTESEIIVPVFADSYGRICGTIDAESGKKNAFSETDAAFLEDCAAAIRPLWDK